MADRAAKPVTAGLSQVAQMDRRERARIVRQLCQQYPAFRSLLTQVTVARGVAFTSGLALALAVMFLAQGVSVWWVATLVLGGLVGFGYVAVVLTDSRFDLLLAVLGAHRTDELHGRLVTDQIYGEEKPESQQSTPPVVNSRPAMGAARLLRRQNAS
ncbi:hypothetical protein HUO13_30230 [Saccharopolyspora erythraea]|uniref:hypothetical protein n=1 Tax=Saccharopolyspora erythraea TaxID=1836 RepID=UPI001BAE19D8|nr:hypothetical protein [Saccharopolyspora erythraea]QUH04485.1 hypothetical protein HUO13_30230 [Saccharopolyspora erythraea]